MNFFAWSRKQLKKYTNIWYLSRKYRILHIIDIFTMTSLFNVLKWAFELAQYKEFKRFHVWVLATGCIFVLSLIASDAFSIRHFDFIVSRFEKIIENCIFSTNCMWNSLPIKNFPLYEWHLTHEQYIYDRIQIFPKWNVTRLYFYEFMKN